LPLVAPLATGHSDVALGSRLFRGAMVTRQWKREVISHCYNLLIQILFGNRFSDAQCGFKAIKRSVAQELLPWVEDGEWFFDTELLLLAEERGYRVSEVPVDWIEDLDTRVDIGLRHRSSCPVFAAYGQGDRGRRGSQGGHARENGA
jgi:hypothetical protein